MKDLKDKNIIVTGGGGIGVGGGVCEALAEAGANLVIVDIDSAKLVSAQEKYASSITILADISIQREVDNMFSQAIEKYGQIHGLVNNAGIGLSKESHHVEEQEYDHLMAVNLKAYWLCAKRFTQHLLENKFVGHIVNITSVHAEATTTKYAIYSSSKHAIKGLTKGLALDLGKYGIRVNAVAPGYVHAEQNFDLISTWTDDPHGWVEEYKNNQQAINRFIEPIDVGHVVGFLLSDLSKAITGQQIVVDQGTTTLLFNRDFVE